MADAPRKDFFISYTSVDRIWTEWIAWALEAGGYSTIVQDWDFRPATNFVHSMQEALIQAERLLAVLSPDYLTSRYAQPEWYAAFAKDSLGDQGLLLPVKVRECEPEGLLSQVVHINLLGLSQADAEAALLAGAQRSRAKPQEEPPFPPDPIPEPRFPGSLPPVWNVPHDRNPNFTGRAELLADLYDALHAGQAAVLRQAALPRQALRGLGGVGKTQTGSGVRLPACGGLQRGVVGAGGDVPGNGLCGAGAGAGLAGGGRQRE